MKKLLVILLLFFVVGCSKKSEQVFCSVEGWPGAFNVKFNQKEQYVIIEGLSGSKKGKRRNRIVFYDYRKKKYIEIPKKEFSRIMDILTNPKYQGKKGALHKKRKKIYDKWFISGEFGINRELLDNASVTEEYLKITNEEITFTETQYLLISLWELDTTRSRNSDYFSIAINRITGDVTYTNLDQDWDSFNRTYRNIEYKKYRGKCSKDRKF